VTFTAVVVWFAAAWWVAAIGFLCLSTIAAFLQPLLQRWRARGEDLPPLNLEDLPPVSLVVPVKALDPGFRRAQESLLAQSYPEAEFLVSAAEEDSPALAAIRDLAAGYPAFPARILRSTGRFAASPKLNNLIEAFRQARHDLVFMKDSNTILAPGDLEAAVRQLTPDVGLVVAVPVATGAKNFAARIEESIMNGAHARALMTASVLRREVGVGKFMLFRRSDLDRAGGIAALASTVGEDNAMGKALAWLGLRTVFSHRVVRQELGSRSLTDVYNRQMRWAVIRRDEERTAFILEPLSFVFPATIAASLAAPLLGLASCTAAAATIVGWFAAETLLAAAKGWGLSLAAPIAFLCREIMLPCIWLNAWLTNRVVWAQGTYVAKPASGASAAAMLGSGGLVRRDDDR
jgi:ceramide glucosyltransferase